MGIVIRRSLNATLVGYVGFLLGAFNQVILFPAWLTPAQLGIKEVLLSAALFISMFSQFGVHFIMARFFPYFEDRTKQHNGFLLFCLLLGSVGFLSAAVGVGLGREQLLMLFAEKSPGMHPHFWLVLPLTFCIGLQNILETWSRLHMNIMANTLTRELLLRVALTILALLFGKGHIDFGQFLLGYTLSYLIVCLLLAVHLKRMGIMFLDATYLKVDKKRFAEMLQYGAYVILGGAGYVVAERIDGLMLASMTGLEFTGIYSMAFFIAALIELPRRAISQLTATLFAGHWKNEDFPAMQALFRQVSINQFLLGALILLLIWTNLDFLFWMMPNGEIYRAGRYVVLIIGLTKVVDLLFGGNHEILLNSPAYRFSLIALVFLGVISFSINYLMIPIYGMNGAAAGTVVSVLLYNSLKSGFIWFRYQLWAFDRKTMYALLLVGGLFALQAIWPTQHMINPVQLLSVSLVKSLVLMILFTAVLFRYQLSPEISEMWLKNKHLILNRFTKTPKS